jgi:HAD superfamily hydrolase (TIGR01509 family)
MKLQCSAQGFLSACINDKHTVGGTVTDSSYDAVVFDFDGLLADSEPLQIRAWQEFLAKFGKKLEDGLVNEMFGLRVMDSSRVVQERLDLPISPEEVMIGRDEIFLDLVAGELPLMNGARELVTWLREYTRLRLALATSGHRRYINAALGVADFEDAFEIIVTGDDVQNGKPHPEIYQTAAGKLGIEASRCIALEDAPHGVRSAKAAGMACLAIPNEMTESIPGLDEADAVLPDLHAARTWIETNAL